MIFKYDTRVKEDDLALIYGYDSYQQKVVSEAIGLLGIFQ